MGLPKFESATARHLIRAAAWMERHGFSADYRKGRCGCFFRALDETVLVGLPDGEPAESVVAASLDRVAGRSPCDVENLVRLGVDTEMAVRVLVDAAARVEVELGLLATDVAP